MIIKILVISVLLFFGREVYAASCSNTACGSNDMCCDEPSGAKCYDPQTFSCNQNENSENVLCGYIGGSWYPAKACGKACYDEYEHECCNGQLYSRFFTKNNPCRNPPGTYEPGCELCDNWSKCCVDVNNGASCYSPGSYLCLNSSLLCAIQNEVPNLGCESTCYNYDTHTCCNGVLYSKQDNTHACAPQTSNTTIESEWDSRLNLVSAGFSSPGGTACGWEVGTNTSWASYQLQNCTQWSGSGGFRFNESSYLVSFDLPASGIAYRYYELDVYIDNSNGDAKQAAVAVADNYIDQDVYIANSTLYTYPCNIYKLYALPLHNIFFDIEAGFSGYKTVDVTKLATWSFSSNPTDNIQLLLSSFSSCSCYTTSCTPEGCVCGATGFTVNGKQSTNPPKLILSS